ncbi:MAG TPA: PBP1A family penicillin-binding protein [Stellaceae bacterium]|nr:PBP1A family penicillin-binding protein [Stellaceae bacterium]
MMRLLRGIACAIFVLVVVAALGIGGFVGITLAHFERDLPEYQQLVDYAPATGSKVYAGDGSLMAEYASQHRIPVSIEKVPRVVIEAFLAAEDRDFYNHNGVNPVAIVRAAMSDLLRFQRGQRPIGASTITQQVVRHFLLNNELSIARKIKEAILAYRIEGVLSKNRILEIYLNEIYLGAGAYGVAAAADTYFQKPLDRLTLAEVAFLAALPKAPNNYHPIRNAAAARARRDWVLTGMADVGWITAAQAKMAMAAPLTASMRTAPARPQAAGQSGYFSEEVRRELIARFGEKSVYEGGLTVRTSYQPTYQQMAETAFRDGLVAYDRRHGWRGPLARLPNGSDPHHALADTAIPPGLGNWQLAAVTAIDRGGATIALKSGGVGQISLQELRWARRTLPDQRLGGAVRQVRDVVNPGDVVLVEPIAAAQPNWGRPSRAPTIPAYALRQIPDVSGGVVVMDPKTGRVFALVGGWSFQQSQFDRATQAKRQPGSAIKPLVYVTALQNGLTPLSIVNDLPVELPQAGATTPWQPENYGGRYVGPTTLDDALVHSRNLATVNVAMTIGLPAIAKTVQDFGVMDRMPHYYSMALGAGETTLLRLTSAYAMLDNGGHWLNASVIDVVQDRDGRILYQKGIKGCAACFVAAGPQAGPDAPKLYRPGGAADPASAALPNTRYADNAVVYKPAKPDPLASEEADTEILAMMQRVVQRGTGTAVAAVGKPLAGKTGTTSDWYDAWFVGFSPDLVAGVFVGFDEPRTLGDGETGGHVAAPIFRDFMAAALKDKPATPFPVPARAMAALANPAGRARGDMSASLLPPDSDPERLDNATSGSDEPARAERDDAERPAPWPRRPAARDDTAPAAPYYYAPPDWQYYSQRSWHSAQPYWPGYTATRPPAYPAPPNSAYAAPGAGSAYPAYPAYPNYPGPSWGPARSGGTGGLY